MFAPKTNTQTTSAKNSLFGGESDAFVQPKLSIGQPGDRYEVEADRAADQIVARDQQQSTSFLTPTPTVQRQTDEDVQKQELENEIQQKPVVEPITPAVQLKTDPMLQQSVEEEVQTNEGEEEVQQQKEDDIQAKSEKELTQAKESDMQPQLSPVVQKQAEEDIQEKEDKEVQEKEEEESLQKQSTAGDDGGSNIEQQLSDSKGGGSALDSGTQSEMESGFGADFSGVRVHNDSNAVQMNQELGSQAFTNGNDIYFNEGKYNPSSDSGKHLLAHELTHTVQQGTSSKSAQPKMIQRSTPTPNPPPAATAPTLPVGASAASQNGTSYEFTMGGLTTKFDTSSKRLTLPFISISDFKSRNSGLFSQPFIVPTGRNTDQPKLWSNGVSPTAIPAMDQKIQSAKATGGFNQASNDSERIYFFKGVVNPQMYVFGNEEHLHKLAKVPSWDDKNNPTDFQIDHIVEHQLGGHDGTSNYELLDSGANGSSGASIMWEMNRRVMAAFCVYKNDPFYTNLPPKSTLPSTPDYGNQYVNKLKDEGITIEFAGHDFSLKTQTGHWDRYWSFNSIVAGDHLNKIQPLTAQEVEALGTPTDPGLFVSKGGGERVDLNSIGTYPHKILPRVDLRKYPNFTAAQPTIEVDAYKAKEMKKKSPKVSYSKMTWNLEKVPNAYIFYVNKEDAKNKTYSGAFQSLRIPGMSPIQINNLTLNDNGFYGEGKVLPTIPLIKNADVDIIIDGDSVRLRKLFTATEFDFPRPFSVDQATLEVFFGTDGLGFTGQIDFGIEKVGTGFIRAGVSTGEGLELEGEFNFDSKLFDPAKISVEYKYEIWKIEGQIGIPEGKVKGVKSANITASYSEDLFRAFGNAELDIPGVEQGTMEVEYDPKGFEMGGMFNLNSDIPGIRGGSVEARVSKKDGEEDYGIFVSGTAEPDVPGINSSLTVTYDNDALTIEGTAQYSRGMLSGEITLGATNRTIGDDGQPNGEPDDTMRVYGEGSLTLQLTPWLSATSGVNFLPNGEMEVTARLDAPRYDVFPRQEVNKNLFTVPTIEIPLFAIPLGPKSIGLVAQIGGGLDFTAGFGPGHIRNVYAEITYNPNREEETTVRGHGEFAIPADAGLTLRGDLSIGASVAIASITGGIELAGTLGLAGEALASVDLGWTPQTGLEINAEASILVSPKFTFDINAFLRGTLGVGFLSVSETWRTNLASYEWGPGIEFGIRFPVNYKEGEPFSMSLDDIEIVYPELDIPDMASDIASDVKDEIF